MVTVRVLEVVAIIWDTLVSASIEGEDLLVQLISIRAHGTVLKHLVVVNIVNAGRHGERYLAYVVIVQDVGGFTSDALTAASVELQAIGCSLT